MNRRFKLWMVSGPIVAGAMVISGDAGAAAYPGLSARAPTAAGEACVAYEMLWPGAGVGQGIVAACGQVTVSLPITLPQSHFTTGGQIFFNVVEPGDASCDLVIYDAIGGGFVTHSGTVVATQAGVQSYTIPDTAVFPGSMGNLQCTLVGGSVLESVFVKDTDAIPYKTWPGSEAHAYPDATAQACVRYASSFLINSNCSSVGVALPLPTWISGGGSLLNAHVTIYSTSPGSVTCQAKAYATNFIYDRGPKVSSMTTNGLEDLDLGAVWTTGVTGFAIDCTMAQDTELLAGYTTP